MKSGLDTVKLNDKIRTFRWLFYMSLFPIVILFLVPILMVPIKFLFHLELLAALTVGNLFAFYFLGINLLGLFLDKRRKKLYLIISILMSAWILWAVISWAFIEHMNYLF